MPNLLMLSLACLCYMGIGVVFYKIESYIGNKINFCRLFYLAFSAIKNIFQPTVS